MIQRRLIGRKAEDRFWLGLLYCQVAMFGVAWAGIAAYRKKYPGVEWRIDLDSPAPIITWERVTQEWPIELYNLIFVWDDVSPTKEVRKEVAVERNTELAAAASQKQNKG